MRLALIALSWNWEDRKERFEQILVAPLSLERRPERSQRRQLDGEFYHHGRPLAG